MQNIFKISIIIFIGISAVCNAQSDEKKVYTTTRIKTAPNIDGDIYDLAWSEGQWQGGFIQNEPREGIAPSQNTEFKILFDNSNMYIAVKSYDTAPDSIVHRLTRRDEIDGDNIIVIFDSYHDLRTGFGFSVSSTGVKGDLIFSDDGNSEDDTWDPIWFVKTKTYDWGWAAEMKIPFTQLRFSVNSSSVWGLNIARQIYRYSEMSLWQRTPRDASGFIHFMGELDGLQELSPKKQFDLTPYVTGGYESFEKEEGNPFADGNRWVKNIGLDGKIGISNNMTLDFTINPDFGQVEADPSEVNLTAFESFFEEKRPFFIEGKNITSFGIGIGDGGLGNDNLFYSRRIGRRPQRDISLMDNEFADIPTHTSIIGAAKLTGKTENGWSIGIIESLAREEKAEIDLLGARRQEIVEPLSNYFVGRLQKDFNKGNTIIGGQFTNTLRYLNATTRDNYHRTANTGGVDFTQFFKDKNWTISVSAAFSDVIGNSNAIASTQKSPVHYFQRPDADYVTLNENRKSLAGHGGIVSAGKIGGKWNFMYFGLWKSPGLELNDLGYLRTADQLLNIFWGAYHINEPFSVFKEMHFNGDYAVSFDYGGNFLGSGYEFSVSTKFNNYYNLNLHTYIGTNGKDNSLLRGGPSMKVPGDFNFNCFISSDERKKLGVEFGGNFSQGYYNSQTSSNYSLEINYRPVNALKIEIEPEYSISRSELQYIDELGFQSDPRYLFGHIDQQLFRLSFRANYSITPDLTIQYWGQPFAAAGNFSKYKMITDPKASSFQNRYQIYSPLQKSFNETGNFYGIDEDMDGAEDYRFDNPNFNQDEFLSNLVVRWEFVPGSTIFFVWSQKRENSTTLGNFSFRNDMKDLFNGDKPYNVFLMKFSYRIGLR